MDLNLRGKKAIITGASRGIGLAIADGLAAEGAAISICARGQAGLDAAVEKLSRHGGQVHAIPTDVGDKDQLEAYMDAASATMGGIDVLINNPSGFGRTDDEEGWSVGLNVDLMALVRASWKAVEAMRKAGGGSIVHISSISGLTASTRTPPYGAVKAAVIQYTLTQAAQLAPDGIRVNCIAPGSIFFEGGTWDDAKKNNPALYEGIKASIPSGRLGTPEEVANLALFLASDAASWVTGQTIAADGGQML
ncbi:MAG: SDR family NAD(P)-dependent oxidoreductase [Alphaproteobacteria bacterium]